MSITKRWLAAMAGAVFVATIGLAVGGKPVRSALLMLQNQQSSDREPIAPTVIGMNLAIRNYWASERVFNDVIQSSGDLRYIDSTLKWLRPDERYGIDSSGRPINIPQGATYGVLFPGNPPGGKPNRFECHVSPGWDVRLRGPGKVTGTPDRFVLDLSSIAAADIITLGLSARDDHVDLKDLWCTDGSPGRPRAFDPDFISEVRPFKVIRFKDWARIDNSPVRTWSHRATPDTFSQAGPEGVALEYMVSLANELNAAPWFSLPMDAEPDYYRQFAIFVRDHVDTRQKIYVELSNEVWNSIYRQSKDATARGLAAYPGMDQITANNYYYADRVRGVMQIWRDVFAGQDGRLVRVLAGQAVVPARLESALIHNETWRFVDAVATAPYFAIDGHALPGSGTSRVDAAFAALPEAVDRTIGAARNAKAVAHKYHLQFMAYEGGPAVMAYGPPDLTADLVTVNRDPRMYAIYSNFLNRWKRDVGGLLILYNSASKPGPGGQFGHREYTGQPLSQSPKARAVLDFIARQDSDRHSARLSN